MNDQQIPSVSSGGVMPAEWARHERCLMAWPTRDSLWSGYADEAKREYAATANAIADFEPVTMVASPGQGDQVRALCTSGVDVVEIPIDDSWLRDSGPIIAFDGNGQRIGIDFGFNSWGERFKPFDKDAAVGSAILSHLEIPRVASAMILEGGSITVDGEGTLITTEQCLLNHNRNPSMSRESIEAELRSMLGVSTIIWLKWGHFEDGHTDGHVDGVCTYAAPGVVVAQTCEDPENPNYELMAENLAILRGARDAQGRALDIVELPHLPYFQLGAEELLTSYPNFYVANGAVIVPTSGGALDASALDILRGAFPDREVVGVVSKVIAYGGGGTHCITQQIPSAVGSN